MAVFAYGDHVIMVVLADGDHVIAARIYKDSISSVADGQELLHSQDLRGFDLVCSQMAVADEQQRPDVRLCLATTTTITTRGMLAERAMKTLACQRQKSRSPVGTRPRLGVLEL